MYAPAEVRHGQPCVVVCVLCGCVNSGPRHVSAGDFTDSPAGPMFFDVTPLSTDEHIWAKERVWLVQDIRIRFPSQSAGPSFCVDTE